LEAGAGEPKDSEHTAGPSATTKHRHIVYVTGRKGGIGFTGMPGPPSTPSPSSTSGATPAPTGSPATTTGSKARWNPEERRSLALVTRTKGWAHAERHAYLILEQARSIGML
jgi:hypothetical protein